MPKNRLLRKGLAVAVIVLFIGVALAPSINVSVAKASVQDDFVEVTTEACGIKGFGNTTVKLTRQQYQNLEQYLTDFRERLNKTTTREEAVPIFNEAVVELNRYGLLPKGMSVEQAQKLVISQYQNNNMEKLQRKLFHNRLLSLDNNSNLLCLIAGNTNGTVIVGLLPIMTTVIDLVITFGVSELSKFLSYWLPVIKDIATLFLMFIFLCVYLSYIFPATMISLIILGFNLGTNNYFPAEGWIYTLGMNHVKSWSGSFYGQYILPFLVFDTGVIGFTGIKLSLVPLFSHHFYLGSALLVKIGSEPPSITK